MRALRRCNNQLDEHFRVQKTIIVKMGLRLTAAAPAIASIAATALGIVLLASGSSTSTANNNYWIAVSLQR